MLQRSSIRTLVVIWLAWVLILLGYQAAIAARLSIQKPDTVLPWTARDTSGYWGDRPYLQDPFLNSHVAWDSEFYLSIALRGYDDPIMRTVSPQADAVPPFNRPLSLNYAFFPVYPALIRLLSFPLSGLGLGAIATATLAGVLISITATLGAMLALYDLARQELSAAGGIRAAFYLIAFPTGFVLAQVYTEGLFVGLSYGCLAFLNRKCWLVAALQAAIATLTRAVGVALLIPLALAWVQEMVNDSVRFHWKQVGQGLLVVVPLLTYLVWKQSFWGRAFDIVERQYFKCEPFALSRAWIAWRDRFLALFGSNSQTVVYFMIEFGAIALGLIACVLTLRRYPGIAAYGLVVIAISMTCGVVQGMHRYVLAVPSVFLLLSQWGGNPAFDRAWTLGGVLLMGMLATLFTFDLWVG